MMDHSTSTQALPPYPPIHPQKNPYYARLLAEDYAGVQSELTAIAQYLYQSVLTQTEPALAKTLARIAQDEMHHLQILAKLIHALGGDPQYRARTNPTMGHFWSGQNVCYQTSVPDLLFQDIQGEKAAIEGYRRRIACILDESVRQNLQRILLDEERHLALLTRLLQDRQQRPCGER